MSAHTAASSLITLTGESPRLPSPQKRGAARLTINRAAPLHDALLVSAESYDELTTSSWNHPPRPPQGGPSGEEVPTAKVLMDSSGWCVQEGRESEVQAQCRSAYRNG
jgi:hypothetical protein